MAKKSVKSKGYRKTVAKRPYISKKELIILCVVVAALIVALILFNVFYNDGSLKVINGVAQTLGSNSLIVKGNGTDKYYKVGQLADIDGYTLTSAPIGSDENVLRYTYTPDDPSVADTAIFSCYIATADTLIEALAASYDLYDGVNRSDVLTTTVNDHKVYYIVWSTDPEAVVSAETTDTEESSDEETSEAQPLEYMQVINAYVDVGSRTISLQLRNDAASAAEYVEESALVEMMNEILAAVSYETK